MRPIRIHKHLLSIARHESFKGDVIRSKMSALAISNDHRRILAQAHNKKVLGQSYWTLHAEERLLSRCREVIETILIYRANGCGSSRPCPKCYQLIKDSGVKRIIYNDGKQWLSELVK